MWERIFVAVIAFIFLEILGYFAYNFAISYTATPFMQFVVGVVCFGVPFIPPVLILIISNKNK